MNQDMLCGWLGLPKTAWPPEPRTLLGLRPDEQDAALIEQRVQERMAKLRCYQLSYPEEATEGMNRLAEAFITLTDARKQQDSAILAPASPKQAPVAVTAAADWHEAPPPVQREVGDAPEPIVEAAPPEVVVAQPFAAPAKPIRRGIDPTLLRELAEQSEEATSNLGTLEAIIERVDRTRVLLHAWERLGKSLKGTSRKITSRENESFAGRLDKVAHAIEDYPAFLGHPGKPGYRVVVQARLGIPLATVRGMSGEQREDLLADWNAGRQILLAHRKYLLRLFKSMRRRTAAGLVLHAVRAMVNDYPFWTLAGAFVIVAAIVGLVFLLKGRA